MKTTAQTCPVCQGMGRKPVGFYSPNDTSCTGDEVCHSCHGQGFVLVKEGSEPMEAVDQGAQQL